MQGNEVTRRGKQAIRSTTSLAMPPEETEIVTEEQKTIDKDQEANNYKYASLKGHPGWELIKKDFEATIASYRSGAVLKDAIPQKSLEEIGKLTLVTNMVADELEHKVLTVEAAAAALEEDNGKRTKKAV